jgi:hypothetical protein
MAKTSLDSREPCDGWVLPESAAIHAALQYFWQQPRKSATQNITFKLHNLSNRKVRLLLEAFVFITNIIATILESWRESPEHPRGDRAIAAAFQVQDKGVYGRFRTRALSNVMRKQFDSVVRSQNTNRIALRLAEGAYRDAARMIVCWIEGISTVLLKDKPKGYMLVEHEFQTGWEKLVRKYQQGVEIVVSLDYDPDHPPRKKDEQLIRKSKRDARWILDRLRPLEEIKQTLAQVEALITDEPSPLKRAATTEQHPWQIKPHQRTVSESWLLSRVIDSAGNREVLGQLDHSDLENLRDELYEMQSYIERAQQWIEAAADLAFQDGASEAEKELDQPIESSLATKRVANADDLPVEHLGEAIETQSQQQLRDIIETFLYAKPDSYPQVAQVLMTPEALADQILNKQHGVDKEQVIPNSLEAIKQLYERRLGWFQLKTERKDDAERFLSRQRESEEVQAMFKALRAIKPPKLQPLFFAGTTRPINYRYNKRISGQYRDGALLYERKTINGQDQYRFVFAAILHEHSTMAIAAEHHMQQTGREKQLDWYQRRRSNNSLWYVNFPETPFHLPEATPVTFFPLECGQHYHERLLRTVIELQRAAQQRTFEEENQSCEKPIPITKCLPEHTPIASARITCKWNQRGQAEFYLHVPVETASSLQPMPTRIISFSSHENTFVYAVVAFDGTVEKVGDIILPKYLDPELSAKPYSENYVFWLANAMLAKAWAWEAYIAVEDVSWTKQRASASRGVNREIFRVPTGRIITLLKHKARQEGWMEPRLVDNISPAYDCAECQHRLMKGGKTIWNEWVVACPELSCRKLQRVNPPSNIQTCRTCGHTWELKEGEIWLEQFFSCTRCYSEPRPARYNRAIVVAQKGLIDLVEHFMNSTAKRKRDQRA